MRKILLSTLIIGGVSAMVIGGTMSFFSDTEISPGNTFTAGTIDIAVNGENHWTETFDWDDIKPGRDFEITLNITNEGVNPLKLWKIIKCVETDENEIIEPEQEWYDEFNGGVAKNDIDSAIVYEMYVDGQLAISKEAGITMSQIKDNYIGLMKLDVDAKGVLPPYYGILQPGELITVTQRYFMPEGTENWAQSDIMTFVMEIEARQVSAPEPLQQMSFMDNKYPGGIALADETMGILKYDYMAPTFNYDFLGVGLNPSTEYCLIYYADMWPGNNPGYFFASGYPDSEGVLPLTDQVDLGMDLPDSIDANYPYGAKIWLVNCNKYNKSGRNITGWAPNDWLFDNWPGFINYRQGDRPNGELNCDYGEDNGAGAGCTDADSDYYFVEASGCTSEPGFLGHDDCDDNEPLVNPGAAENCDDGLDNDCDGDIDAADSDCPSVPVPPTPGDIVINEIMQNPAVVSDANGEWFELYNKTVYDIELENCVFTEDGSNTFTIIGTLVIPEGGYLVLGRNDDDIVNGGVDVDYDYPYVFALGNDDDEIILTCNSAEIDRVEYKSGFPLTSGKSMSLRHPGLENNDGSNWCVASSDYDSNNKGTPGGLNDACPMIAYLDTFTDIDAQHGYWHDYTTAASNNVAFTYTSPMAGGKLSGTMAASNLKPYATYQVKLTGVPTCLGTGNGNDLANEYVGSKGRWTCPACPGNANQRNRSDAQYEANKLLDDLDPSKECIVGYLVFDYFTADATGNIEVADMGILSDTSYHVLRCGGGNCGDSGDAHLGPLDPLNPAVLFCPFDKANGEIESGRGGCYGLTLDSGIYYLKMSLTEECFHQLTPPAPGTMNWAEVLVGDIDFEIE